METVPNPPRLDPTAPLTALRPGQHPGLIFVRPIYRELGYQEALGELWLRVEVAQRLAQAATWLLERETTLLLWDGWRPEALQQCLWLDYRRQIQAKTGLEGRALDERTTEFVSPPGQDHGNPAAHSTGGAVDLTLCTTSGQALDMGGEFDELTDRSHPDYYEREGLSPAEEIFRDRRRLLNRALAGPGFWRLPTEWWHFEYGTPNWGEANRMPALFGAIAESEQ